MRHQADAAALARGEGARVLPEDQGVTVAGRIDSGQQLQQGGFPGPVAANY